MMDFKTRKLLSDAQKGDVNAQFDLAMAYYNGSGVDKDPVQCASWMLKAAQNGSIGAMENMGIFYNEGYGVPKDPVQSALWMLKAAQNGAIQSMKNMGLYYSQGYGVPVNPEESLRWYLAAANNGDPSSQNSVGAAYFNGEGVARNFHEALRWFSEAAKNGDSNAKGNLGTVHLNVANDFYFGKNGVSVDYQKAFQHYQEASKSTKPEIRTEALFAIGNCYRQARGVDKNVSEALRYLKEAYDGYQDRSKKGNAACAIGNLYFENDLDLNEAAKWYQTAASLGDINAEANLKILNKRLESAPAGPASTPESQEFVFCTQCGNKNSPGSRFCSKCGNKLA